MAEDRPPTTMSLTSVSDDEWVHVTPNVATSSGEAEVDVDQDDGRHHDYDVDDDESRLTTSSVHVTTSSHPPPTIDRHQQQQQQQQQQQPDPFNTSSTNYDNQILVVLPPGGLTLGTHNAKKNMTSQNTSIEEEEEGGGEDEESQEGQVSPKRKFEEYSSVITITSSVCRGVKSLNISGDGGRVGHDGGGVDNNDDEESSSSSFVTSGFAPSITSQVSSSWCAVSSPSNDNSHSSCRPRVLNQMVLVAPSSSSILSSSSRERQENYDMMIAKTLQRKLDEEQETEKDFQLAVALQEQLDAEEEEIHKLHDLQRNECSFATYEPVDTSRDTDLMKTATILSEALTTNLKEFVDTNRTWLRGVPCCYLSTYAFHFLRLAAAVKPLYNNSSSNNSNTTAAATARPKPKVRLAYKFTSSTDMTYNEVCTKGFSTGEVSNNIDAALVGFKKLSGASSWNSAMNSNKYSIRLLTILEQPGTQNFPSDRIAQENTSLDEDGECAKISPESGWIVAVLEFPNETLDERLVGVRSGLAAVRRVEDTKRILPLVRFDFEHRYDDVLRQVMNALTDFSWEVFTT